ncbi:MAG: DUF465 domain-containing protein [Pseudobdellovibrionaceae bacterium]|nr:DUF465 domain-containing protein [Pseudobdellovibrionaceae bacterium]
MPLSQNASARQQSLQHRHSILEERLRELSSHPSASDTEIRGLKLQKLRIKEEMESR